MKFTTPGINQGQIVTCSYACDEYYVYKRVFDASDRTTLYYRAEWDSFPDSERESSWCDDGPGEPDGGWEEIDLTELPGEES